PAQPGALTLSNPRFTYGILGPVRGDAKVQPGDTLALQFEIDNISVDKDGKVKYSTTLEILDPAGKSIFTQPGQHQEGFNNLGGNTLQGSAAVFIGLTQAPGEYPLKVTVKALLTQKSAVLTQKAQVIPRAFGFVGLTMTADGEGRVPAGLLGVGESLF